MLKPAPIMPSWWICRAWTPICAAHWTAKQKGETMVYPFAISKSAPFTRPPFDAVQRFERQVEDKVKARAA